MYSINFETDAVMYMIYNDDDNNKNDNKFKFAKLI